MLFVFFYSRCEWWGSEDTECPVLDTAATLSLTLVTVEERGMWTHHGFLRSGIVLLEHDAFIGLHVVEVVEAMSRVIQG